MKGDKIMNPTLDDILILSKTIYGEARGEYNHPSGGLSSLIGVANVIINRLKNPCRFGKSIQEICLNPYQFSCWNINDPNKSLIASKDKGADKVFDLCYEVAEKVAYHIWPDITKECNHYHAPMPNLPKWAQNTIPRLTIGNHVFYKL